MKGFDKILPALLSALILGASGCKTTPAGDGTAQFKSVILPEFPIGHPADYEFRVRHNQPVYPHWLYFRTRERTGSHPYTPFDRASIKVEVVSPEGKTLHSTTVRPRAPRIVDGDEYRVLLWGSRAIPAKTDFVVRVEVLKPSGRRYDRARIHLGTP